jgi:putative DNA primase/helicase
VIPEELRNLDQWVSWRVEDRGGRPTKVPYGKGRVHASSTDADTWLSYESANYLRESCGHAGVGFVFTSEDPYAGVDMDDCVSRSGAIHLEAYRIVQLLGGYVEFSPSGRGLHVLVKARLERGRKTMDTPWRDEFAIYDRGRFFTMLGDGRGPVREAQREVDALLAELFPEPGVMLPVRQCKPVSRDDGVIVDQVLRDVRMGALWAGDVSNHADNHSDADLALCNHLAFLTGNDAVRMDSLFRQSGLYRDKWDERRGDSTYGEITIRRAMR